MIEEDKNEKYISIFKVCLLIAAYIIIGICGLFIILITKVDAASVTTGLVGINIGNDTTGNNYEAPNYEWFNYGPNLNYINGNFSGHNGAFNAHILVELNYGEEVNPSTNAQITILAYINNNNQSGVSGTCPKIASGKYNCDIYLSGTNESNSDVIVLQLKTYGTYYTNHVIQARVSGSITYDDSTANLNNGSFNQGISSINSNISGASSTIIENQNSNSQAIIDNQNANSQAQIDAIEKQNLKCENYNIDKNNATNTIDGYNLTSSGSPGQDSNWKISDYLIVNANKTYTIEQIGTLGKYPNYCLYGSDKSLISCERYNERQIISFTPQVDGYVRFSIGNKTNYNTKLTGEYCYNMLDKQNQTSENIESALTDSSVSNPSSDLQGLESNFGTNSVISDLLLLPVSLYQNVLNSINGTCTPFTLGSLYNHTLRMPCINVQGVIGSAIYGVIDVLISGFFILSIRKKFVDIFESFTSLKVGGNELE